jgi:CheY-like chemotaxis protein
MQDPEDLVSELYRLIAHLNDTAYLERHRFARLLPPTATPGLSRGQALRRTLRMAITALDPGSEASSGMLEARPYRVLYRYAISRHSILSIADDLGLSRRQVYRDLRVAVEALAEIVRDSLGGPPPAHEAAADDSDLRAELERLAEASEQEVEVSTLVDEAARSALPLARERKVELRVEREGHPLRATTNRVMLRQAVLNLLSHAVSTSEAGAVHVRTRLSGQQGSIECHYRSRVWPEPRTPQSPLAIANHLLSSLGMGLESSRDGEGITRLVVTVPLLQEHDVLIVDDNEAFVRLFRRYLRGQPYRVHGAGSMAEAIEAVQRIRPDVVILDVMMPERDGWELLETLRTTPEGQRARIIVCSIINDPELSAALGADGFLLKPVERADLLQALSDLFSSPRQYSG